MNVPLVLFLGVLAVLLFRSDHPSVGLLVGAGVIGWLVLMPFVEHFISADRIRTRPRPPPRRGRGRR